MKIELVHTEIEEALVAFVAGQGINISDKAITVDMTAGRGSNGYTASISLDKQEIAEEVATDPITEAVEDEDAVITFGDE